MRKNIYYVVTPRCAAAAVVSAVVLRRPTKEYTHPYSMMHRRLPTAGIEVAPNYHQLLVRVPAPVRHMVDALTHATITAVVWGGHFFLLFFFFIVTFTFQLNS